MVMVPWVEKGLLYKGTFIGDAIHSIEHGKFFLKFIIWEEFVLEHFPNGPLSFSFQLLTQFNAVLCWAGWTIIGYQGLWQTQSPFI